jgi:hypothetical protein
MKTVPAESNQGRKTLAIWTLPLIFALALLSLLPVVPPNTGEGMRPPDQPDLVCSSKAVELSLPGIFHHLLLYFLNPGGPS